MNYIFLDGASGNPLSERGMEVYANWNEKFPYNKSSFENYSFEIQDELEKVNNGLLEILNLNSEFDVIWNSGATEGIYSTIIQDYISGEFDTLLYPRYGLHPTAMNCIDKIGSYGCELIAVDVHLFGDIKVESLKEVFNKLSHESKPRFYLESINGLTGAEINLSQLKPLINEVKNLSVVMDITQTLGKIALNDLSWCDVLLASCHKYGGVKGVGVLISKRSVNHIIGENGLRKGTFNHLGVFASFAALKQAINLDWKKMLRKRLNKANLSDDLFEIRISSNHISLLASKENDRYLIRSNNPEVIFGFGTACSKGIDEYSVLLKKIMERTNTRGLVRISV